MDTLAAMGTSDARKLQNLTFLALFLGAGYFLWRTMEPIWLPVFLGLIIAVSVNPLHQKLRKRWRNHDGLSAAALTAAVLILSVALVAFLFVVVGERVVEFAREAGKRYQSRGAAGFVPHDALPLLEKLSRDEPNETLRNAAKRTTDEIRGKTKPAAQPAADVTQLRQELERLKREQEALQEKLRKFEKGEQKK